MPPLKDVRVVCRRLGQNRIDELLALEHACFETDRISRANYKHLLRSPSACCLGAFGGGRVLGSVVVLFRKNSRMARIYSLAVSPDARGRGLGRQMILAAEREARTRGCRCVRLEVRADNIVAQTLYERLGYVQTALRPEYYEDGAPAYAMQKELV